MRIAKIVLASVAAIVVVALLGVTIHGSVRTARTQRDANQAVFLRARPPVPDPEGRYDGTVPGRTVAWKGKQFRAASKTGINLFENGGAIEEKYPFKTYVARGIRDPIDVFKIDYDLPGNPIWLRHILDEVVEVAPGEYLGKIHVRWLFGSSFALGYFKLHPHHQGDRGDGMRNTAHS